MPFDKQLPTWLKTGTKPPDNVLNTDGWKPGDKPPADWLNWFFNTVFLNLQELQQEVAEKALVYTKSEVDALDDQAEANAINWVKGFGLGDVAKDISNTDLNTLDETGFYRGATLTNTPTAGGTWFVINQKATLTYKTQLAFPYGANKCYMRANNAGTWSAWAQQATTALGTTGAAGLLQLVDSITSTDATKAATAKSVKDAVDWVKSFGLGDVAKDITSSDLNILDLTGFYKGATLTNAPNGWTGTLYVINIKENASWSQQIAIAANVTYTRYKNNNVWTAWSQLETTAGAQAKAEQTEYKTYKTVKDANGVYTTIEKKRNDGTLAIKSVLSGGTSPQYTTRTITYYGTDGTTVVKTTTRALSYDTDGDLLNEV